MLHNKLANRPLYTYMKTVRKAYIRCLGGLGLALLLCLPLRAGLPFTQTEQTQISVPTPHLFDRSDAFTVDFAHVRPADYSFPLPLGKAVVKDNSQLQISTTKGDAVKAMFAGVVRLSRRYPQYGNTVVVRHDNGLETVYAGNAQNLVKVGQRVKAGQTLAIVGGSGDGCGCLFGIMVNGGYVNPSTLIDVGSHRLRPQVVAFKKHGGYVDLVVERAEKTKELSLDPDDEDPHAFKGNDEFKLELARMSSVHWSYPLPGSHVISPYGGSRHHSGVDIKTRPNDNVLAAFDGVVTRSGPYFGYGNCIVIRHAYGFETLYSHQSRNLVKVGQRVKAGQVIGLTGRTGRATTEHLHFEVHFMGRGINPAVVFDHTSKRLQSGVLVLKKGSRPTCVRHS